MADTGFRFIVFTKPWKLPIPELGQKVRDLGFDGIELPVRPGYPIHAENMADELPRAARQLKDKFDLEIVSVAGLADAETIRACGQSNVPLIRVCPPLPPGESYPEAEVRYQREWESLVPLLDENQVAIGVQNHSGRFVPVHAFGLARLLAPFDPRHVCAVWDAAHNALEGESPEIALDILPLQSLRMVNLKNGFRKRVTGPEAERAEWKTYWTDGRHGLADWPQVVSELKRRNWSGPICLTAEYTDIAAVDRLIAEDIDYVRSLFSA